MNSTYLGIAALVVAFIAGWTVNGWRWEAAEAEALMAIQEKRQEEAMIAANTEIKLAAIERENRTLKGRLLSETHKPDYRCKLPADGLLLLQDARRGTASEPESKMP